MARNEGDLCPHCKEGHLTVHPDREVRENSDGGTASHRTWFCDKCGKTTRDFIRGSVESGINVSDTITTDVKKKRWLDRFRKK
jgi:RNase P subunit RPR2